MTVRIEALFAEVLLFEDSRRYFSATARESKRCGTVRNGGITEGPSAHLGALGLSGGRDIQPSIGIRGAFTNGSIFKS